MKLNSSAASDCRRFECPSKKAVFTVDAPGSTTAPMLRTSSIYCEAVAQPQDIYYEGSEDEDYDDAATRKQRYEAAGQQFLAGKMPFLLSATLKGPFEEESGWVNPWRSKNRTLHSQQRPESHNAASQYSHKPPAASAFIEKQAVDVLKSAEYALPSPESLKQAPITEAYAGKDKAVHGWRDEVVPLPLNDDFWAASSPSRSPNKRKSKSSRWLNSASSKRQRTGSKDTISETPTPRKTRSARTHGTQSSVRDSSIYLHIREFTARLPIGVPDESSSEAENEDEITDDASDGESVSGRLSVDLGSATTFRSPSKLSPSELSPSKVSPGKALQSLYSSSPLSSPFSQPSLLRAISPVSISPAQTPARRQITVMKSPGRPPSSAGRSCLSEAPTSLSDLEMSDVDDDDGEETGDEEDHANSTVLPEPQPQEGRPLSPQTTETDDEDCISGTLDPMPSTAPTGNHASSNGDASVIALGSNPCYDVPRGRTGLRATQPSRMADLLIYDDAEAASHVALPNSQESAANQKKPAGSPAPKKQALSNGKLAKANSPHKSSALQSLSPRNGRINSRPALKKIVQPYISSLRKSPVTDDTEHFYTQEENGPQARGNAEAKESKEISPPPIVNTSPPAPQPSLSAIVRDKDCESDTEKEEESVAHDAVVESASQGEVEEAAEENAPPTIPEQTGLDPIQQEISTEHAGQDKAETQTIGNTSEEPSEPGPAAPVTDGHSCVRQQEQQNEAPAPAGAAEGPVTSSQNIDTPQRPVEDSPKPMEVSQRASTPEPQFAFTSFSSFMSPSPRHRRPARPSFGQQGHGVGTSQGILLSGVKKAWRDAAPKKHVSWAPLPHEETDTSGEDDAAELLARGRDRAFSPPPPTTSVSYDLLAEGDSKFSEHFAAVSDRSKGIQLRTAVPKRTYSSDRSAEKSMTPAEKTVSKQTNAWDDDPTDVVQDIFDGMDDFLQVWDVDAELNEARKADKVRTGKREAGASEMDVGMDLDMFLSF